MNTARGHMTLLRNSRHQCGYRRMVNVVSQLSCTSKKKKSNKATSNTFFFCPFFFYTNVISHVCSELARLAARLAGVTGLRGREMRGNGDDTLRCRSGADTRLCKKPRGLWGCLETGRKNGVGGRVTHTHKYTMTPTEVTRDSFDFTVVA